MTEKGRKRGTERKNRQQADSLTDSAASGPRRGYIPQQGLNQNPQQPAGQAWPGYYGQIPQQPYYNGEAQNPQQPYYDYAGQHPISGGQRGFIMPSGQQNKKAKKEKMLAWLYDEDRWPSGTAGGLVTKEHPEFARKTLLFTQDPYTPDRPHRPKGPEPGRGRTPMRQDNGELLAVYD